MTVSGSLQAAEDKAIRLGHPSYVWRQGQDRRLRLIRQHVPLDGRRILDVGCGLGMYVRQLRRFSDEVYGVDVDPDKIAAASATLPNLQVAPAEALPFPDGYFDVVLLHEVLEHVADDRQAVREAYRCLRPGGRIVIFAPNRLYFFETHGFYLGRRYIFRLLPLINYTPDCIRNRFAPHVRIYTQRGLRRLFAGLAVDFEICSHVFPGFDNIVARHPRLGRALVAARDVVERTPLRCFGISHFMVVRKRADTGA